MPESKTLMKSVLPCLLINCRLTIPLLLVTESLKEHKSHDMANLHFVYPKMV
jgi:hypothetical protein